VSRDLLPPPKKVFLEKPRLTGKYKEVDTPRHTSPAKKDFLFISTSSIEFDDLVRTLPHVFQAISVSVASGLADVLEFVNNVLSQLSLERFVRRITQ
jgi:hypothetical protein